MPATNVLANVYQLYMVENQCALILISHNHGTVEATVNANQNIYTEDQTVFLKIYFFPSSIVKGVSSISREIWRIFIPSTVHKPIVNVVQVIKKVGLRNPFFPFNIGS